MRPNADFLMSSVRDLARCLRCFSMNMCTASTPTISAMMKESAPKGLNPAPIMSHTLGIIKCGLSNIIGIIVYISANSGDPGQSDNKKSYSYGWSFYFGALSFIMAEMVGVLAVHMFIEKHRKQRAKSRTDSSRRTFRGVCKKIDHFPDDADYEADAAEYLL
ncbi:hypothetical protein CRUP_010118, partial [Coryphaenoides rupestris]